MKYLKEIGEVLKESREQNGVSIEEAAEDLNYKVSQLEAIESGNYKTFKDIFLLKCMITDYAKYLGLNSEQIIDEFNEYVFESTSKIPIDDIEKASKAKEKEDKIASPYTKEEKEELQEAGCSLGTGDRAMQKANLDRYEARLVQRIAELQKGLPERKRLCQSLGIMGGLFLFLILV